MRLTHHLRVIHCRDCMLFAEHNPGRFAPLLLALGLALWLGGVAVAAWSLPAKLAGGMFAGAAVLLGATPALLLNGVWLTIDRHRGWIHWQRRRWLRVQRESFSPQRMGLLYLVRRGGPPSRPGWWEMNLILDHPRIGTVCLGRALRLARAQQTAREMAASLEIEWVDEKSMLHVAMPRRQPTRTAEQDTPWTTSMPPPPEILIQIRGRLTTFVLPSLLGFSPSDALLLLYALMWCLWAWTGLLIKSHAYGPAQFWDITQSSIVALLVGGSVVGLILLGRALLGLHGSQVLTRAGGKWVLARHWLGLAWARQQLECRRGGWMRRVDPPGAESGLWIPSRGEDVRLGAGLSAECLAWLQDLLGEHTELPAGNS